MKIPGNLNTMSCNEVQKLTAVYTNIVFLLDGMYFWDVCQQTQNICITFIQCWTSVEDVGPTFYECYTNALCLLGWEQSHIRHRWCTHSMLLIRLSFYIQDITALKSSNFIYVLYHILSRAYIFTTQFGSRITVKRACRLPCKYLAISFSQHINQKHHPSMYRHIFWFLNRVSRCLCSY